eukprot:IDg8969t1
MGRMALVKRRQAAARSIKPGSRQQEWTDWVPKKERLTVDMLRDEILARAGRLRLTSSPRPAARTGPRCISWLEADHSDERRADDGGVGSDSTDSAALDTRPSPSIPSEGLLLPRRSQNNLSGGREQDARDRDRFWHVLAGRFNSDSVTLQRLIRVTFDGDDFDDTRLGVERHGYVATADKLKLKSRDLRTELMRT